MPDIINLLPDSVANQIAAGEVIQRPASVIKELVENSIDAKASEVTVIIVDSGRTLIQIIDNGQGMSETDARMSFERHATSKIRNADDLFAIRSMGFRGEALASVAAIAEVCLQTKREIDELGTQLTIRATEVIEQCPVACPVGANFSIKNLFFNVPARRKFLKSDAYEFRLIVREIQKVALAFPEVQFTLFHNKVEVFKLPPGNRRNRIAQIFGKSITPQLIDIKSESTIVKISGFIGKPETARKNSGEQFFYVNSRYMKHPYFHKAIINAYERILGAEMLPSYFIYFDINPENIDVNIHPTKTEIKFEDEQSIWQILNACTKESLGKFNVAPSLDFENEKAFEIPVINKFTEVKIPEINYNPNYNPFDEEKKSNYSHSKTVDDYFNRQNTKHWEKLFNDDVHQESQGSLFQQAATPEFMQLKNKYILLSAKSGLMIIDQKRAHERILFEQYLAGSYEEVAVSQKTLFPQVIEMNPQDHSLLMEYIELINKTGFDIRDFGNNSIVVNGCPAALENPNPKELVSAFITELNNNPLKAGSQVQEYIASLLAKATSINHGKSLSANEMNDLVDRLFACSNHNFCPDGKPVISILGMEELEKRLK